MKNAKMKYCEIHKQKYRASIPECPICKGEKMTHASGTKKDEDK